MPRVTQVVGTHHKVEKVSKFKEPSVYSKNLNEKLLQMMDDARSPVNITTGQGLEEIATLRSGLKTVSSRVELTNTFDSD